MALAAVRSKTVILWLLILGHCMRVFCVYPLLCDEILGVLSSVFSFYHLADEERAICCTLFVFFTS